MAGEIEEQVLEIRLAYFHAIQPTHMCGKQFQARVDIVSADLDDTLCLQNPMFDAAGCLVLA